MQGLCSRAHATATATATNSLRFLALMFAQAITTIVRARPAFAITAPSRQARRASFDARASQVRVHLGGFNGAHVPRLAVSGLQVHELSRAGLADQTKRAAAPMPRLQEPSLVDTAVGKAKEAAASMKETAS